MKLRSRLRLLLLPLLALTGALGTVAAPAVAEDTRVPGLYLAEGWPSRSDLQYEEQRLGPSRADRALHLIWCAGDAHLAPAEDRVTGYFTRIADESAREARAYVNATAARRAAAALVSQYRDCPAWRDGPSVNRAGVGGAPHWREGARIAIWRVVDGEVSPGTEVAVVVQRGNLVLLAWHRFEDGQSPRASWRRVNAEADAIAPIIRRMERAVA